MLVTLLMCCFIVTAGPVERQDLVQQWNMGRWMSPERVKDGWAAIWERSKLSKGHLYRKSGDLQELERQRWDHACHVPLCRWRCWNCFLQKDPDILEHPNRLHFPASWFRYASSFDFLPEVGRCFTASSGDLRETSFLFQHLSILIQRFNSVLTQESFISTDEDPDL